MSGWDGLLTAEQQNVSDELQNVENDSYLHANTEL